MPREIEDPLERWARDDAYKLVSEKLAELVVEIDKKECDLDFYQKVVLGKRLLEKLNWMLRGDFDERETIAADNIDLIYELAIKIAEAEGKGKE